VWGVEQDIVKHGWLKKLGGKAGTHWQARFFVLRPGSLSYFESEKAKRAKGSIMLDGVVLRRKETPLEFVISHPLERIKKSYVLRAESERERAEWMEAITESTRHRPKSMTVY
jgi:hypothetical protein